VITARGEEGGPYDFISRFFAGSLGIAEDPVTGSAHCSLATYWAERLHKNEFFAYQASPRGGELKVVLKGNRVLLKGEAVTVMAGAFSI
jgi:predicted PhzF superfamily epimerase YddE/YHI9